MKLHILSDVLFDEFPKDETIKYCFFTQPKYQPDFDYSIWPNVKFYCCEKAYSAMSILTLTANFELITEKRRKFSGTVDFWISCVPTGNPSGSVMLLIELIDKSIHLYTGQFTAYQDVLVNKTILRCKDRLNDIHVDNTIANSNMFGILRKACQQIEEIVNNHAGYKIFLNTDVYGYEELIFSLAQNGIKIRINKLQKILFTQNGHSNLFEFEGEPQLHIHSPITKLKAWSQKDYERKFEKKVIHIKLILIQHEMHRVEKIKGLFLVPYTPHASAYDLSCLFQAIEPQRIYPLFPAGFGTNNISEIPKDILNDHCEFIQFDDFGYDKHDDNCFLEQSEEFLSESVEDIMERTSAPLNQTCNETNDKAVDSKSDPLQQDEIYTIDDDDAEDDPGLYMDSSSQDTDVDDGSEEPSYILKFPD